MKKVISVLLTCLLILGCAVPTFAVSVNESKLIDRNEIHMTAHRGYSSIAPENTLAAFRLAGEHKFWGAECDIMPTSDGVWVIMHDDTVDRTTNGKGNVTELTFEQISALKIDSGKKIKNFPNEKVPTLEEYLDVCKEYNMHPVIEIKQSTPVDALDSLAELLNAREDKDMFVIITFGNEHAAKIKKLMPKTPVYLLLGRVTDKNYLESIQFCLDNNIDGIDMYNVTNKKMVKSAIDAGLKTMVWTVDDIKTVEEFYSWGVRDFTTNTLTQDEPDGKLKIFEQFFQRLVVLLNRIYTKIALLFK